MRQADAPARRETRPFPDLFGFSTLPQPQKSHRRSNKNIIGVMDQLIQRFLLYLRAERNASAHTLRAYQHDLKAYNAFLSDKYPRLGLDRSHRLIIRDYLAHLHEENAKRPTVMRAVAVLRAFYKFLIQEELTTHTPFAGLPMPKREKRLPRYLPEDDMNRLLDMPAKSTRGS